MSRIFYTNGTGPSQSLNKIPDNKEIPVYADSKALELDIDNLEVGQVVSVTEEGVDINTIMEEVERRADAYIADKISDYGPSVGSYLTMEDNSVTPQGYLLADGRDTTGTADELLTKYPLLYAYLGNTNVLPEIGDKLDYENAEALTYNSNTSNEAATVNQQDMTFTMTRSGLIILNITGHNGACGYVQVNGKVIDKMAGHGPTWLNVSTVSIPVQKGDVVNVHLGYTFVYTWYNYQTFIPYKTHKYIKAVSGIETASTEAAEVTNAINTIKAYVSDAEEYSTTEVKTNKTWIDGKPIYRVVHYIWHNDAPVSPYTYSGNYINGPLTTDAERIIDSKVINVRPNGYQDVEYSPGEYASPTGWVWVSDTSAYYYHGGSVADAWCVIEYTKTTD